MLRIQAALTQIAHENADLRARLVPMLRQADKWQSLPKGWDQGSVEKFWQSLTGDSKRKVTECIKQMDTKVNDPGAFCASLADRVLGPEWRSKKAVFNSTEVPSKNILPILIRALREVNFNKRKISVYQATTYNLFFPGDDGSRGFATIVDIDNNRYSTEYGDWGGGGFGAKKVVDDQSQPKQTLPDHMVVIKGQVGGHGTYASLTCTPAAYNRVIGAVRMASERVTGLPEPWQVTSIVKLVIKEVEEYLRRDPYRSDPKAPVCGVIHDLFSLFSDKSISRRLWDLFERSGPSMTTNEWSMSVARKILNQLGSDSTGRVLSAAVGLSLLKKTKQHRLTALYEKLMLQALEDELQEPQAETQKPLNPSEKFNDILDEMQDLVQGAWRHIQRNPAVAQSLVWQLTEDTNWHSFRAFGITDEPADSDVVSYIAGELEGSPANIAVFGFGLLKLAKLTSQANALKSEALAAFPERFDDQQVRRVAFNKFNAPELLNQLLGVLKSNGLEEIVEKLKDMKVPQLINEAWKNRGVSE